MKHPVPLDNLELLSRALDWSREGRRVALATVIATWGSSPRPVGSMLVVDGDCRILGSVSGGCVESAVVQEALGVMDTMQPRSLEYGVSNEQAWEVGLACGGSIRVYVEPVDETKLKLFEALQQLRQEQRAAVLVTRLEDGSKRLLDPQAEPQDPLAAAAAAALRADRSGEHETDGQRYFLQVYNPPLRLVLVGAVHIAQALVPMAKLAGYEVTVVDPRSAFVTEERFPEIQRLTLWPKQALQTLAPDARTAVVTLSHDPKIDDPALIAALSSDAFYVGALGSRRTHAGRLQRLAEQGLTAEQLERIHAPVGLAIGARSPAEIALSVMAQITAVLRLEKAA